MSNLKRLSFTAGAVLLAFLAVMQIWTKHQFLVATVLLLFAFTALVGWINAKWTLGALPDPENEDPSLPDPRWTLPAALGAMAFSGLAYYMALHKEWLLLVEAMAAGAVCWRFCLPAPLPKLPGWAWGLLGGLAVVVAAFFRLYRAGDIPEGFAGVDETALWTEAYHYMKGLRLTYGVEDGVIPYYLLALGLKLFGGGFQGWRMEGILTGIFLTGVVFQLGRALGGRWTGAIAAFLWAVCLWPVTISRAPYFMAETYLMVLMTLMLLAMALYTGRSMLFAMAGLFWAFTFNCYPAARVMLGLVPWLMFLVWLLRPQNRPGMARGWIPLMAGLLIGLAPLLIWYHQDPVTSMRMYGSAFIRDHQVGGLKPGIIDSLEMLVRRAVQNLPPNLSIFTSGGEVNPFYFPYEYPLVHKGFLFLFLAGFAVCLARFRSPLFAFTVFWWIAGLVPALMAQPGTTPNSRRDMMVMPPSLLMAAVGLSSMLGVAVYAFKGRVRLLLAGSLALGLLAWLGQASWNDYFHRNQKMYSLMSWGYANAANIERAVWEENRKGPLVAINTRRLNLDVMSGPNEGHPVRGTEFGAVNPGLPCIRTQEDPAYYENQGLFGSLKWAIHTRQGDPPVPAAAGAAPLDVLVILTPFHYYLEPMLHRLGGQTVREIPLAQTSQGPIRGDVGQAFDDKSAAKLVRLPGLTDQAIDALAPEYLFNFKLEELTPPPPLTRQSAGGMASFSPEYRKVVAGFLANPGAWRPLRSLEFKLPDPWFWMTHGKMPKDMRVPFRLSSSFELLIPQDGNYAFGASATPLTTLRVDGRTVFQRDPSDPKARKDLPSGEFSRDPGLLNEESERRGFMGEPVALKKGTHRLDLEQAWISANPVFGHLLRPLWQAPGGAVETLPLEVLRPRGFQAGRK